jgi:SulP family sulfate permease
VTQTSYLKDEIEDTDFEDEERISERKIPDGIAVFEIYGPFFFGAADKFKSTLNRVDKKPKVIVLRMRHVLTMDATGLHALEDVYEKAKRDGTALLLSGVHAQPLALMKQSGFADVLGMENMTDTLDDALTRAREVLSARETVHAGAHAPGR